MSSTKQNAFRWPDISHYECVGVIKSSFMISLAGQSDCGVSGGVVGSLVIRAPRAVLSVLRAGEGTGRGHRTRASGLAMMAEKDHCILSQTR